MTPAQRRRRVKQLLYAGHKPDTVASTVKISRKRVFDLAAEEGWPTNPNCGEYSKLERQIYDAHHFLSEAELERAYRVCPKLIQQVITRVERRLRRHAREDLRRAS